jgi:hypothetical protein
MKFVVPAFLILLVGGCAMAPTMLPITAVELFFNAINADVEDAVYDALTADSPRRELAYAQIRSVFPESDYRLRGGARVTEDGDFRRITVRVESSNFPDGQQLTFVVAEQRIGSPFPTVIYKLHTW